MPDQTQKTATMADWLRRHELTQELCLRLLDAVDTAPKAPLSKKTSPVTCTPDEVWKGCVAAFLKTMPQAAAAIETMLSDVRLTFAAPPFKYPRAFTLHDDGQGKPFVYVPWSGQVTDVLAIAHEFGHALQIVASAGREMPPAAREACAIMSETLFVDALSADHPAHVAGAREVLDARADHHFRQEAHALRQVLTNPDTPYDYRWNYPIAQGAVLLSKRHPVSDTLFAFFSGHLALRDLI